MNEDHRQKCRKCGAETTAGSNFCNSCGVRIYDIEKLLSPRKFSIKLSVYSAILTFIFILLFSFFTAYFYTLYDQDILNNPDKFILMSMAGPILGILISSLFTTYILTPIRINETVTGASFIIIAFKVSDFIIASAFTLEGVSVALFSCILALAGAWLGFYLKKKFRFKS